jgi:hypothetical protein
MMDWFVSGLLNEFVVQKHLLTHFLLFPLQDELQSLAQRVDLDSSDPITLSTHNTPNKTALLVDQQRSMGLTKENLLHASPLRAAQSNSSKYNSNTHYSEGENSEEISFKKHLSPTHRGGKSDHTATLVVDHAVVDNSDASSTTSTVEDESALQHHDIYGADSETDHTQFRSTDKHNRSLLNLKAMSPTRVVTSPVKTASDGVSGSVSATNTLSAPTLTTSPVKANKPQYHTSGQRDTSPSPQSQLTHMTAVARATKTFEKHAGEKEEDEEEEEEEHSEDEDESFISSGEEGEENDDRSPIKLNTNNPHLRCVVNKVNNRNLIRNISLQRHLLHCISVSPLPAPRSPPLESRRGGG